MTYKVSEISGPTMQGEGRNAGRPCALLRLAGCNLWVDKDKPSPTCPFCDTESLHHGQEMTIDEVVTELRKRFPTRGGVIVTGGEPLLQLDEALIERLYLDLGPSWIDVETNGTVPPKFCVEHLMTVEPCSESNLNISLSPKNLKGALGEVARVASWVKILIPNMEHLLTSVESLGFDPQDIYLQPVMPRGGLECGEYRDNLKRCLEISWRLGYSVSLQLHKAMCLP